MPRDRPHRTSHRRRRVHRGVLDRVRVGGDVVPAHLISRRPTSKPMGSAGGESKTSDKKTEPALDPLQGALAPTEGVSQMKTHLYVIRCGEIGDDQREVELEPLTAPSVPEPIHTPAPTPAIEPEKVPA